MTDLWFDFSFIALSWVSLTHSRMDWIPQDAGAAFLTKLIPLVRICSAGAGTQMSLSIFIPFQFPRLVPPSLCFCPLSLRLWCPSCPGPGQILEPSFPTMLIIATVTFSGDTRRPCSWQSFKILLISSQKPWKLLNVFTVSSIWCTRGIIPPRRGRNKQENRIKAGKKAENGNSFFPTEVVIHNPWIKTTLTFLIPTHLYQRTEGPTSYYWCPAFYFLPSFSVKGANQIYESRIHADIPWQRSKKEMIIFGVMKVLPGVKELH